jgi:hypothetical protein
MTADRRAILMLVGPVSIPVLVGVTMGYRWPDAGENFYSSTSQVIATLFIAIAVEFFAREAAATGRLEAIRLVLLVGQSWVGFFACVRALAGSPTAGTVGLAGAGVTAASVLVSVTLYDQIMATSGQSDRLKLVAAGVVLFFLFPPVIILILV